MRELKTLVNAKIAAALVKSAVLKKLAGDAPVAPTFDPNKWAETQTPQLEGFSKHIESPLVGSFGLDQSYKDRLNKEVSGPNYAKNVRGVLDKIDTRVGGLIPDFAKSTAETVSGYVPDWLTQSAASSTLSTMTASPYEFKTDGVPQGQEDAARNALISRALDTRIAALKADPAQAEGQDINVLRDTNWNRLHRLAATLRVSDNPALRARGESLLQEVANYRNNAGYKLRDAKDFSPDDQKRWDAVDSELAQTVRGPDLITAPLMKSVQEAGVQAKVDEFNTAVETANKITSDPNYKGPGFTDWLSQNWQSLLAPVGLIVALTGGKTGAIIGLGMAAWGGYDIYQKFNKVKNPAAGKAFIEWSKSGFSKDAYQSLVATHGESAAEGASLLLPIVQIGWAKDFAKSTAVDKANDITAGLTGARPIKVNQSPTPAPLTAPAPAPAQSQLPVVPNRQPSAPQI
jgi:hypothetical protein